MPVQKTLGDRARAMLFAARRRLQPERHTQAYARLFNIGGQQYRKDRPLLKPSPSNLRNFARTPYARRAINTVKLPIAELRWDVRPKEGVKPSKVLEQQMRVVADCLNKPNNEDSFRSFTEQLIADLLIGGAFAYEHAVGGDANRPLWMWPTDSLSIQVFAGWDGNPKTARYMQTLGAGNVGGATGIPIAAEDLVYGRGDPTTDTPFSWGALEVAFQTVSRLLGVGAYAGNVASNASPGMLLNFGGSGKQGSSAPLLDDNKLRQFRDWWRNDIEGQGMTPITSFEAVQAVNLRGADDRALFLEYQDMLKREIAAAFGISPMNLAIERDVNRDTAEVSYDRDWDGTIKPTAHLLRAHINRSSIEGRLGFSQIELTFPDIDREDEKATADIYKTEYQNNATTPNMYRARKGLEPIESAWGDMTYADVQIAIKGAQGAKQMNPDLATKE
ncbi:phage portal protein [Paraburkholderia kururiensis]|uniref:phage portal protein n=1 Tax=Paraburkholderia kururiensis TaxID=984307 RepID=UPI0005A84E29|nr:phage portal protein [Paraburkholderia kururiensis]